jgi:UPF0755 protein
VKKIFLGVLVITVVASMGFFWFWYGENKSTGSVTEEILFVLENGESASSVALRLQKQGIIENKYFFLGHLAKNGNLGALQTGAYTIVPTDTPAVIADRMARGEITRRDSRITFPEGWTALQMSLHLTEKGFPGEAFLELVNKPLPEWQTQYKGLASHPTDKSLEGFLFPDTYYLLPEASGQDIIEKMLQNFDSKVDASVMADAARDRGTFYNTLIVASIVEEEGDNEIDRKMMADIFWKRLDKGQPFQSDVTVNYASGVHKQKLYLDDIDIDSPYNTYKYAGLTPTPISNPGKESILAAVYPTPNPYYFFITDPETKKAHFSETFQGHVENRDETGL